MTNRDPFAERDLEAPDADAAEQAAEVTGPGLDADPDTGPSGAGGTTGPSGTAAAGGIPAAGDEAVTEADPADRLEQARDVPLDEDDYR